MKESRIRFVQHKDLDRSGSNSFSFEPIHDFSGVPTIKWASIFRVERSMSAPLMANDILSLVMLAAMGLTALSAI
jgi:hypothetical protein